MDHPVAERSTLRIGWVDHWNMLPMRLELTRLWPRDVELILGTPREINDKLLQRQVDVAPSSSICLLNNLNLDMALPLGVACDGRVGSVYLGFPERQTGLLEKITARTRLLAHLCRDPVADGGDNFRATARQVIDTALSLPPIQLDELPSFRASPHSATSNALTRLCYLLWFGDNNYLRHYASHRPAIERPQAQVVIGDEALQAAERFEQIIDLGEIWKEISGLPFVFAVWQSYKPLTNSWQRRLLQAAELASARMRIDPSIYLQELFDDHGVDIGGYWQRIYYFLRTRELQSLYLFLNLCHLLPDTATASDSLASRLVRWEGVFAGSRINDNEVVI